MVCPFRSLEAQHTIAKQQGTKIGRFYYFSTVAGGGPDLTEIMLVDVTIEFVSFVAAAKDKKQVCELRPPCTDS